MLKIENIYNRIEKLIDQITDLDELSIDDKISVMNEIKGEIDMRIHDMQYEKNLW